MTKALLKPVLISAVLVLLCTPSLFAAEILTEQTIVILDPGHTPKDPGLENDSGLKEFTVILALASHLKTYLSETCRVRLAGPSNDSAPDETASALANRLGATLFISLHIHSKASTQPAVFYFDLPDAADTDTWQTRALGSQADSKKLATAVANAIKADQPGTRPMVLPGPILPLEGINMPGILVEPFALSQIPHPPEKRSHFLEARARVLANAVLAFLADKTIGG